jgi:hypothetical protein
MKADTTMVKNLYTLTAPSNLYDTVFVAYRLNVGSDDAEDHG